MRDEFTKATREEIAKRAGYLCSNPDCQSPTVGAAEGEDGFIDMGEAGHITAASPDGPRYDPSLPREQRRHHTNGIWLCRNHGKVVDSNESHFTVEALRTWKRDAEKRAFLALVAPRAAQPARPANSQDQDGGATSSLVTRLLGASRADLASYKRMPSWPHHAVTLNLRMIDGEKERAFQVAGLAAALDAFNEISIIAAPGTGKTTTLIQVADEISAQGHAIPLFVPLGEWSSQANSLLQSLMRRPAFRTITEQEINQVAADDHLVLLLDGWNELNAEARRRATAEIRRLRRDFPSLGVVISTRRQALDVPINGPIVQIDVLTAEQQLEIARALSGEAGQAIVDRALRTPGVRSLISLPLYLTALLAHASGGAMPTTKEAILRLFVTEHEREVERAEVLRETIFGFHTRILIALAVEATIAADTSIAEDRARSVVRRVEESLTQSGQITSIPQPMAVLDVLIAQHALVRSGTEAAFSFQHQQFQEWYASFEVEQAMRAAAASDAAALQHLRVDILDLPAWEEPILFACERLSRESDSGADVTAAAVMQALQIDPMLAAEMICRAAPAVWERVRGRIAAFVERWHVLGRVDRAVRFAVTTGRPEFGALVWPLIENPDTQIHLSALRAGRRFRPSVLGPDAAGHLTRLPDGLRGNVLSEIVMNGGPDGIELATAVAKADPSADVQSEVIEALVFRRANRQVTELLGVAVEPVWTKLAQKGYANEIGDTSAATRLRELERQTLASEPNRLALIGRLLSSGNADVTDGEQIGRIIESAEFPVRDQNAAWQIQKAYERFAERVGTALVQRLAAGREIPFRAEDLLTRVAVIDEGPIPTLALDTTTSRPVGYAAARVIGPETIGRLIDARVVLAERIEASSGRYDQALSEQHALLSDRISASREAPFIAALLSRGQTDQPAVIGLLASLLSRHGSNLSDRRPLTLDETHTSDMIALLHRWTETVLTSPQTRRHQLAEVATAIGRLARPELLPDLKRLLDDDLARWRHARERRRASPQRLTQIEQSDAAHSWTPQFRQAFAAIGDAAVVELMGSYLEDEDFSADAALVLHAIWNRDHGTPQPNLMNPHPDFADVAGRRAQRASEGAPEMASPLAEMIFAAVERLMRPGSNEKQQQRALVLGHIGLSMPHGNKCAVIDALLASPQPILIKRNLLAALVLDGEIIKADIVLSGLRAWVDDARQHTWKFRDHIWELEGWLELLPFTDRPSAVIEGVELAVSAFPHPQRLERVVSALAYAPGDEAELDLGVLMHRFPGLAGQHEWVRAVLKRETVSAGLMLIDLIFAGSIGQGPGSADMWWMAQQLTALAHSHSELRSEILRRYQIAADGTGRALLERVLASLGDADGVLAIVHAYAERGRSFDGLLQNAIHAAALSRRPAEGWSGAYELHPVALPDLRRALFAMVMNGPAVEAALGAACLTAVDDLRDEYGSTEFEPRHPDISAGRPWPPVAAL